MHRSVRGRCLTHPSRINPRQNPIPKRTGPDRNLHHPSNHPISRLLAGELFLGAVVQCACSPNAGINQWLSPWNKRRASCKPGSMRA